VPDEVSPRDPAQLRDLGLLVDEQPAADVEAWAMAAGAFAAQPPGPVGEARWPAAIAAGDPGRISRRSRLLRGPSSTAVRRRPRPARPAACTAHKRL
jgi:hypothetical protein